MAAQRAVGVAATACRGLATTATASSDSLTGKNILVTGSFGQLGMELVEALRPRCNFVMATDIRKPAAEFNLSRSNYRYLDVLDINRMEKIVVEHNVDSVVHFSALLSAIGEERPDIALQVNNTGTQNVLTLAARHNLAVFCPSTIGAFGPSTPLDRTPDLTIMRPTTIYGITKVHAELLGEYYNLKYGVDFRSLRLPGIISADSEPGGGTTDYAVSIFHHLFENPGQPFHCYLREDTSLPMMEIGDCIGAITQFMAADNDTLKQRTYNIGAANFNPTQLAESIRRHVPNFEIICTPDSRQGIADSWPNSFDDSNARADWSWEHQLGLDEIVDFMIGRLSEVHGKGPA